MSKSKLRTLILLFFANFSFSAFAQYTGVKTNIIYWGTGTFNLAVEMPLSNHSTLDIQGGYNPWNLNGTAKNNKKIAHWLFRTEYRYWLCQKFMGHYFGIHPFYLRYNIGGYNIPLLLEKNAKNHRYKGDAFGAGLTYGYQWPLSKRLNLEANIGFGYAYMQYDKFDCQRCGKKKSEETRHYVGPTRAGISLIYFINKK